MGEGRMKLMSKTLPVTLNAPGVSYSSPRSVPLMVTPSNRKFEMLMLGSLACGLSIG